MEIYQAINLMITFSALIVLILQFAFKMTQKKK